eukprot:678876-Pyramimonas_sp.AAC.1
MKSIVRSTGRCGAPKCPVVSRGVPKNEIDSEIDREIDRCPVVSYGVPLSEIDSEIDGEIDVVSPGVPWWPVVARGVPLSEIDSEMDNEIDKCPVVSRGVPLNGIDNEIDRRRCWFPPVPPTTSLSPEGWSYRYK